MLRLRPYKNCDAKTIISWCKDEASFRKWTSDRYESFPITEADMNTKYVDFNGDCVEADNFYPMTACDDNGVVGHLIMRYVNGDKSVIRLGFVIVDDTKRGNGYGKEMIKLAVKYSFEIMKAEKITIGVFENNLSAYYCYKSAGFKDVKTDEDIICELFGEKWKIIELELCKEDYSSQN